MIYHLHDFRKIILTPARLQANLVREWFNNPMNPYKDTPIGKTMAANAEMFERMTRKFTKPEFELNSTKINGKKVAVEEQIIVENPFCSLINFKRKTKRKDPNVLVVAPMSGHHATLLRGTVEALLPHHNVYVTDWIDAREVPLSEGDFDLDTYISYIWEFLSLLGPNTHIIAVCQPAVPVLAAVSLMASENDPNQPLSMTLMGGPIDTRVSKTAVTELAEGKDISWFKNSVTMKAPLYYPGASRNVYPGFIQLSGFMSMNLDKHIGSHVKFYNHLVEGDGDSAAQHKKFYNEYLSVMDLTAEFYLQTVETVFQRHNLPKGTMKFKDRHTGRTLDVRPQDIKRTALLTVEGERDDISALGQTVAAHNLCTGLSTSKKFHHLQENVGHYGMFNGRRWREFVMPRIRHFIRNIDKDVDKIPDIDIKSTKGLKPEQFNKKKHWQPIIDEQNKSAKETA